MLYVSASGSAGQQGMQMNIDIRGSRLLSYPL
jgi:hypothetical protein